MPLKVPGPEVELRPIADARYVAPQSTLPQVGAALSQAGGVIGDVAKREQELRDADRLFRAEASLRNDYLKFETGLRDRRGQNAWGVTDDVESWFEQNQKTYTDELDTDNQRRLFGRTLEDLRLRSVDSAAAYEQGERRVSLEESARASIASAINMAAASHDNDEAISAAKTDVLDRVQIQSQFNGWTPERRAAEEALQLTTLHRQVLEAMVDTDPERARAYFAANKSEIAGADREKVGELVRVGGLRALAQRESDKLLAQNLSETETLKRVRDGFEGQERDEIEARVKTRFADVEAARAKRERDVADEAWGIFAREHTVASLPVALLDELDGKTLQAMQVQERQDVNSATTKWDTYYDLRQRALDNPTAFATLDLRPYFHELAPSQRESLIDLQKDPRQVPAVATLTQQLAVAHGQLGLAKVEERGAFDGKVQQALSAAQNEKGEKPLTYDERQVVIDRMMVEGEVVGGGFFGLVDPDRRYYEVVGTPDERKFRGGDAPQRPGPRADVPAVATDDDYAALPTGSVFRAPDGTVRRKP